MRDNGPNGWCWDTEAHVKNITLYMKSSGLFALGYNRVNIDEGWLVGRNANGVMYEDLSKFPSGMKGLGDWVHGEGFLYGLYSCRGTCQCGTGSYHAPGSHGYEAADVDWMVAAGADYLKIDSCCGDQNHAVAFSDYAKFRDAMNATGKRVWFSLCGWESWYSPPDPSLNYTGGASLGNSWRIAGDGSGWGPLTNCMNTQAGAANFTGPFGWADPDLLIGPKVYVGGQSDAQARAQFTMWSLFPANLLISQNMLQWSDYALETYSNAELIAVNQDPLGSAAQRVVGGDLKFPCNGRPPAPGELANVVAAPCNAGDAAQRWTFDSASGHVTSAAYAGVLTSSNCGSGDSNPVVVAAAGADGCGGKAQAWAWGADGKVTNGNSGSCLDVYDWAGPAVDTWACNGGSNQQFKLNADGTISEPNSEPGGTGGPLCLRATVDPIESCTNVWGRKLAGGAYALGFVNNGGYNATVTCDGACFAATGVTSGRYTVRDLWAHQDVAS